MKPTSPESWLRRGLLLIAERRYTKRLARTAARVAGPTAASWLIAILLTELSARPLLWRGLEWVLCSTDSNRAARQESPRVGTKAYRRSFAAQGRALSFRGSGGHRCEAPRLPCWNLEGSRCCRVLAWIRCKAAWVDNQLRDCARTLVTDCAPLDGQEWSYLGLVELGCLTRLCLRPVKEGPHAVSIPS